MTTIEASTKLKEDRKSGEVLERRFAPFDVLVTISLFAQNGECFFFFLIINCKIYSRDIPLVIESEEYLDHNAKENHQTNSTSDSQRTFSPSR